MGTFANAVVFVNDPLEVNGTVSYGYDPVGNRLLLEESSDVAQAARYTQTN